MQETHEETANRNFGAHVKEDTQSSEHEMPVFPGILMLVVMDLHPVGFSLARGLDLRQLDHGEDSRDEEQRRGDHQVRPLNRSSLDQVEGRLFLHRHPGDLLHGFGGHAEDQEGADERSKGRAQGIECLGEVQAAGGVIRFAQDGHEGIGRNLQQGDA
jgi:hypothetical protein